MRVFLIGYMGSGKSKVGAQLAGLLDAKHVDTDAAIADAEGCSVSDIFAQQGEERFRKLEKDMLNQLVQRTNIVVSTGGGLPCSDDNMQRMNDAGITVYLEASSGLLFHRLLTSRAGRPLLENLSDVELMERINSHLAQRAPVYAQAKLTVAAASLNVKALAAKIKKMMESA